MSSHREAPEISKDPVADSTDVYAFVSPDQPDTVTLIANYIPLQGPAGGPNFYEFGDDVLYEIHIDNDGDGQADITYAVPLPDQAAEPQHVPLQHRADPVARQPELEQPADLHRDPHPSTARASMIGAEPALPAVQHRAAVDPPLRRPRRRGGPRARRRHQGVRRPAGRGLLRGPGLDLRPRQPAPVRGAARPVRHARLHQAGPGVNATAGAQRAHDRASRSRRPSCCGPAGTASPTRPR